MQPKDSMLKNLYHAMGRYVPIQTNGTKGKERILSLPLQYFGDVLPVFDMEHDPLVSMDCNMIHGGIHKF